MVVTTDTNQGTDDKLSVCLLRVGFENHICLGHCFQHFDYSHEQLRLDTMTA